MNKLIGRSEKILAMVITLIALANVIWLIFFLRDVQAHASQLPRGVSINVDTSVLLMHVRIATALVIAAISSWFKKVLALLLSFAALIWIVVEYARWYAWSLEINRESGVTPTHALYGADSLNWTIIMVVLGLLIWELAMILNLRRTR